MTGRVFAVLLVAAYLAIFVPAAQAVQSHSGPCVNSASDLGEFLSATASANVSEYLIMALWCPLDRVCGLLSVQMFFFFLSFSCQSKTTNPPDRIEYNRRAGVVCVPGQRHLRQR